MAYALVRSAIAPIMKDTTYDSSLEDEVLYGMKVELIEQVNPDWYRIRTHYQYEGFMNKEHLLINEESVFNWDLSPRMVVIQPYADVLSVPKVQGANVISLTRGAQIAVLEGADENGWVKVGLVDGRVGYMKEKFISNLEPSMYEDDYLRYQMELGQEMTPKYYINNILGKSEESFRYEVIEHALRYLGTQYRWGGKTSLGIDCSGLTSISYMLAGLVIYRDADIKEGFPVKEIPYHEKKPGDLLYFPGHIAMYIGDDRYIHSTGKNGSDGVVINSLNPTDEDYREDLVNMITATGSVFY